jgi:ABC-type polar amino acid transport system ATPase subunit
MENVDIKIKGTTMTIVVDLSKTIGPSNSGKTMIIATTSGNAVLEGGVIIGLNVYRKVSKVAA